MVQEQLVIKERSSKVLTLGGLIVTAIETRRDNVDLCIGSPGSENIESTLKLGEVVLFENPGAGLLEIRVLSTSVIEVEILVSQISPRPGIAGGFIDNDVSNSSFTNAELSQIAESVEHIRLEMGKRTDVKPEQLDFIYRKLEEIKLAGERLGRKDWKMFVIGLLGSTFAGLALEPEIGKALFQITGKAFSWIFNDGFLLFPM